MQERKMIKMMIKKTKTKYETFEKFSNNTTLTLEKNIDAIKAEYNNADISDVAEYCYKNYKKITGRPTKERNDEGYFPSEIEAVIDHYNFDYDDFSQEWNNQ